MTIGVKVEEGELKPHKIFKKKANTVISVQKLVSKKRYSLLFKAEKHTLKKTDI